MYILISASSVLEFSSVNHTSMHENSKLDVFENINIFGWDI